VRDRAFPSLTKHQAIKDNAANKACGDTPLTYQYLEFETPIADIDGKILELKAIGSKGGGSKDGEVNLDPEIKRLEKKSADAMVELYKALTPWQKAQVARHPDRPHCRDYIATLVQDFTLMAGDRKFGEDEAIIAGFGRFNGNSVAIIGQEKGADTAARIKHNFGMAKPEGYRKAVRIMELADRFGIPVLTFVDTAGAYPGLDAEERGQAEAIARATSACLGLKVPLISVIIGEGGSGGAIAIATANRVFMLEHSIYSVISPEGAASILWRDATRAKDAAQSMKITAQDLIQLKIIDGIIAEPQGGAHRNPQEAILSAGKTITAALKELSAPGLDLREARRNKYLDIGRSL
jgi:acetyl-CoA carboxylase carboxyl transferase subunit alpha